MLQVSPWLMFMLDAAIVALLLACRLRGEAMPTTAAANRRLAWPLLAAVAGVVVLAAGLTAHALVRPPADLFEKVTIAEPSHDFGTAEQMQELHHAFTLTNRLAEPITITHVHSSCGCTTASGVEGAEVPPGGQLELPVTLKTGGDEGRRVGTITVFYRPPSQRYAAWQSCSVQCEVRPEYRLSAAGLDFGTVTNLEPVTRTLEFTPAHLATARIESLASSDAGFTARLLPASGAAPSRIEVTYNPLDVAQRQAITAQLTMTTNASRKPRSVILLQVRVQPPQEVEPAALVVAADMRGEVKKELRLTAVRPTRVRLSCTNPGVRILEPELVVDGKRSVPVTIAELPSVAGLNTEISIEWESLGDTTATKARRVSVPVHRLPSRAQE